MIIVSKESIKVAVTIHIAQFYASGFCPQRLTRVGEVATAIIDIHFVISLVSNAGIEVAIIIHIAQFYTSGT